MQEKVLFSGFCEGILVIFEVIGRFEPNKQYLVIPIRETGSVVAVKIFGNKIDRAEPIIN